MVSSNFYTDIPTLTSPQARKRKAPPKSSDRGSSARRSLIVVLKVPRLADMELADMPKRTTARKRPQTHGVSQTDSHITEELRGNNGAPGSKEPSAERPFLVAFPPLPPLARTDIEPFYRGATIAIENIFEDFVENGEATLMGVIKELEETRPMVHDHERKMVLKGGTFVYETLKWKLRENNKLKGENLKNKRHTEDEAKALLDTLAEWIDGVLQISSHSSR